MNDYDLHIYKDLQELGRVAADRFLSLSNEAIERSGRFSVALSGGSTPKALHAALLEPDRCDHIKWSHCYFFWGDERFVPADHPESNFRMAKETLLSITPVSEENIFRIQTEGLTPRDAAIAYEKTLRNFFVEDGFDLVLLGMGEDGHTASLFPDSDALHESKRWVAENYVQKLQSYRITLTFPAINHAKNILFLISGTSKAAALKEVLQGPRDRRRLPAQGIQPGSGNLSFLVDQESAREL